MSYLTDTVVDESVDQGGFSDLGVPDQDDRAEVEVELGPGEARVVLVEDVQPLLATTTPRLLPMEAHILSDCFYCRTVKHCVFVVLCSLYIVFVLSR